MSLAATIRSLLSRTNRALCAGVEVAGSQPRPENRGTSLRFVSWFQRSSFCRQGVAGASVVFMLAFIPGPSSAIELRWISGSSDLTFAAATRCTLVVQANAQESRLPLSWRLIWVARDCTIRPLLLEPPAACLGDIAQVAAYLPPAPSDSVAHLSTVLFCSAPTGTAATAYYLLDLPAGSSGKLKVAVLDTSGLGPRVIESSEATFNGGVPDPYPPVILAAGRIHPSTQLLVEVIGAGLMEASRVEIAAPDSIWQLTLDVVQQSATLLTAVAQVAADLPACLLRVISESGATATAMLPPDTVLVPSVQPACVSSM
jgi:hypothetical protein